MSLGVRRTDFDQMRRLGWLRPARTVTIRHSSSQGGTTTINLYAGLDVALLPLVRHDVDWAAPRAVGKGRRSPLAALTSEKSEHVVPLQHVVRTAVVGRTATRWRRLPGFPAPADGTEAAPRFRVAEVVPWLLAHRKLALSNAAS
ncbi:hypothetical protein SSPIM334S_06870 [Streptomyces spiroverticillatus]